MTQPTHYGETMSRSTAPRQESHSQTAAAALAAASPSPAELSEAVRIAVGDQNFRHWFQERSHLTVENDQLQIHVPNPFICSWMMKRFRSQLATAAASVLGPSASFVVHVDSSLNTESVAETETAANTESGNRSVGDAVRPFQDPSADASRDVPRPVAAATAAASSRILRTDGPAPVTTRQPQKRRFRSFSTFVSGSCNELPLMAARQISEAPGERFNPLYLHGTTGVGKSHLLESIYGEVRRQHPELNVLFLTSESFTNYFTAALSSRSVPSFRQRFRNVDVLLIDNIEFLGNKKATQEEFLHTIDQLVDHGGQLVLTSDRHPRLLTKHRDELTTRFVSGLVCRIETPSLETRRKLVESLALPFRSQISTGALQYAAAHGGRNARELQGSVNCLVSHAALRGGQVTTAQARQLLGGLKEECRHLVRISDVERIVCEAFGVSVQDMRSKTRRKAISCPRSVAMYVARRLTKAAWREIGQYFGGRDHSTVVAASRRVDNWITEDAPVNLPNSCRGTTWGEVIQELEERLMALAS